MQVRSDGPKSVARGSPRCAKALPDVAAALDACAVSDGAVLSFHHHLRNGDAILTHVLRVAQARGLRGLGIAASSIFPVQGELAQHIRAGTVDRIWTSYMKGDAADAIASGALPQPAIFQSHGGRARALANGEIPIDVAFIAAPVCDEDGALTGAVGRAACGPLGYPQEDARAARHVVALVEEIRTTPLPRQEIDAAQVHHVVRVPTIGDPDGILSGATRLASDPVSLAIADTAARVIAATGLLRDGFSFQTGAGGISLAAANAIGARMRSAGLTGEFISGGICEAHVALAREGLFREVLDVQCFDGAAVASYASDPWHKAMSAAQYASPLHPDPVCDRLDVMVLGAAEIDRTFNINVVIAGDGRIIGGPGGHPDTAAGATLSIATTRLTAGGYPKVVDRVGTITTPGQDVDVLVTEAGVAVNEARDDLAAELRRAGLSVVPIEALIESAARDATRQPLRLDGPTVAVVEARTGGILDTIKRSP